MEDLNQDYGFVLYRKTFPNGLKGKLELKTAQDYTVVMVNGKTVGTAFVGDGLDSNKIELPETDGPATLDLLVYNLGRISVVVTADTAHLARKGLIGGATLDGADLSGWQIYSLPYYNVNNFKASAEQHTGPTFYRGTFILDKLGGTFLDMRNWSMGAVWVNGHNLGRFWDHGGLRSLFLPGEWLKRGQNEIVILELHDAPKLAEVSGGTKIIEEPAVPFAVKLDRADLKAPITPAAPEDTNAPGKLLPLKVVGTKILDSNNQPVRLRGVNAASLEWTSDGDGHILQTVNVAREHHPPSAIAGSLVRQGTGTKRQQPALSRFGSSGRGRMRYAELLHHPRFALVGLQRVGAQHRAAFHARHEQHCVLEGFRTTLRQQSRCPLRLV
jgi:hypothetical protein